MDGPTTAVVIVLWFIIGLRVGYEIGCHHGFRAHSAATAWKDRRINYQVNVIREARDEIYMLNGCIRQCMETITDKCDELRQLRDDAYRGYSINEINEEDEDL